MLTLLEQGRARARMPRTLILEPTRELAAQVEENFNRYGKNHKLTVALLIGGVSFDDQDKKLDRGVDVLIATPGRLLDHFERGKLLLNGVEILVIDEADRMLDMGFIPDIERICKLMPVHPPDAVLLGDDAAGNQRLTDTFLHNPVRVEVSQPATAATTITQRLVTSGREPADKREMLRELIRGADRLQERHHLLQPQERRRDAAPLARPATASTPARCTATWTSARAWRRSTISATDKLTLLVASDVAARGLDIPAVSHVFNFDVPTHAEDYVHRIGRTGRAGRRGTAITIATPLDRKYVAAIEKMTGQADHAARGRSRRRNARRPFYGNREPHTDTPERGDIARDRHRGPRHERGERRRKAPRRVRTSRRKRTGIRGQPESVRPVDSRRGTVSLGGTPSPPRRTASRSATPRSRTAP